MTSYTLPDLPSTVFYVYTGPDGKSTTVTSGYDPVTSTFQFEGGPITATKSFDYKDPGKWYYSYSIDPVGLDYDFFQG